MPRGPGLLLASGSPRRRDLLIWMGIPFRVETRETPELPASAGQHLSPAELAWANARRKGTAVARDFPQHWVLSADTVVACAGRIYGKPRDLAQATDFLEKLEGRTHAVITAVGLFHGGKIRAWETTRTRVTMKPLSLRQIQNYLRQVHVLDKAGAYAAQEKGDLIIGRINGSFTNVMGLPVETVSRLLRTNGLRLTA